MPDPDQIVAVIIAVGSVVALAVGLVIEARN